MWVMPTEQSISIEKFKVCLNLLQHQKYLITNQRSQTVKHALKSVFRKILYRDSVLVHPAIKTPSLSLPFIVFIWSTRGDYIYISIYRQIYRYIDIYIDIYISLSMYRQIDISSTKQKLHFFFFFCPFSQVSRMETRKTTYCNAEIKILELLLT